ncbi:MAG TPA: glutathione peroxidase [Streptosporangiaceae bacterium]
MSVYDIDLKTLAGEPATLGDYAGSVILAVNVASQCGLTPQYEGLQRLHERFAELGFTVAGFPCNQFKEQEPGTADEIAQFCSVNYGVTFPLFAKIDVNGQDRHPLYAELTRTADAQGAAGDVQWNFEKFLIGRDGTVIGRFRPLTDPEAPEVVEAIEASLAG